MVSIFYTCIDEHLSTDTFNYYLNQLNPDLQNKISRYRHWQDSQRSLLGKALLRDGLDLLGKTQYHLSGLKFTDHQRPYFDENIDFNISHSGQLVVCAISLTNKVGIDVEEIKPIPLNDFTDNFSQKEWAQILKIDNDFYNFYKCWTQKEAFLKALGMGLNVPLKDVEIIDDKITWKNTNWYLQEIKLEQGYVSHSSCSIAFPKITVKKIKYH